MRGPRASIRVNKLTPKLFGHNFYFAGFSFGIAGFNVGHNFWTAGFSFGRSCGHNFWTPGFSFGLSFGHNFWTAGFNFGLSFGHNLLSLECMKSITFLKNNYNVQRNFHRSSIYIPWKFYRNSMEHL